MNTNNTCNYILDDVDLEHEGGDSTGHQAEVQKRIQNLQIDKTDLQLADFKIEPIDTGELFCLVFLNFFWYVITAFFGALGGFYQVEPKQAVIFQAFGKI